MSLSLDQAADRFEAKPSRRTALKYLATAKVYHLDEMISDEELQSIETATNPYLQNNKHAH